jgi:regulator of sigma E protease
MESFVIAAASMAAVLGILILLHEFGHYAAAKFFGVRVDVFSIGFGKRLVGFRRGETDYRISALPLGGYVKMAGESPLESRSGAPEEFMSHPRWQRLIIAIAGPAVNIVLAIALLTGIFMLHYEYPAYLDQTAVVGGVVENSPASKAGIQQGDRIVRIEDVQNPRWKDVMPIMLKVMINPKDKVDVAIQRSNDVLEKQIQPEMDPTDQYGTIGWLPDQPITVTQVDLDKPAAKAGLKVGDEIMAVNGTPMRSLYSVVHFLQQNGSKPVEVTTVRNGQQSNLTITPVLTDESGQKSYRLGFGSDPTRVEKLPFAQALSRSIDDNKKGSLLIVDLIHRMVERKASIKQLTGPIGIARASGEAARQPGWTPLLELMAVISLNLGILNLLPIPILDGGIIMLLIIEGIMRRDISIRIKERIYQTALVFLLLFFVVVIYNDVMKVLPGLGHRLP